MNCFTRGCLPGIRWLVILWCGAGISWAQSIEETLEALQLTAETKVEAALAVANDKKAKLVENYVGALKKLEEALVSEGDLDGILHVRKEVESVESSGRATARAGKRLVELRSIYQKALGEIENEIAKVRTGAARDILEAVGDLETRLTREGKVEDALALRKESQRLAMAVTRGSIAGEIPFQEDPRALAPPELKPLAPIEAPKASPPVADRPFSVDGRWLESLTIAPGKQRIREAVIIGDRGLKKWPTVVVSAGNVWAASDGGRIELSAANFVASRCRFDDVPFAADHESIYFFSECLFDDCRFDKGGVWYGGEQSGKFYFERCVVEGRYSPRMDVIDNGLRAEGCVFEDIEFPSMNFRDKQPANYLNNRWLRIVGCRFVECEIPVSFLYLTRNCVFEDCTFVDDESGNANEDRPTKPFEIVLYVENEKWKISEPYPGVTLTRKPIADLEGVVVPTAEELRQPFR